MNTYVGDDGKIHFVNSAGADTVLPFKSGGGGSIVIPGDIPMDKTNVYVGYVSIASRINSNNIGYLTTLDKINFGDNKVVTLDFYVNMRGTTNLVMQISDDGNEWEDLWNSTLTTDRSVGHMDSRQLREFTIPENLNNKSKYLRVGMEPVHYYSDYNQVGITIHKQII